MLDDKTESCDKMVAIINALQSGSDADATLLLARMRLGASVDELLSLEGGNPSSSEYVVSLCGPLSTGLLFFPKGAISLTRCKRLR